jgi:hypothetical protein
MWSSTACWVRTMPDTIINDPVHDPDADGYRVIIERGGPATVPPWRERTTKTTCFRN